MDPRDMDGRDPPSHACCVRVAGSGRRTRAAGRPRPPTLHGGRQRRRAGRGAASNAAPSSPQRARSPTARPRRRATARSASAWTAWIGRWRCRRGGGQVGHSRRPAATGWVQRGWEAGGRTSGGIQILGHTRPCGPAPDDLILPASRWSELLIALRFSSSRESFKIFWPERTAESP